MNFASADKQLLCDPRLDERDACGVGVVAHIKGMKSHLVVLNALEMLRRMEHRGGVASDNQTSDGVGVLLQIPHSLFQTFALENVCSLPDLGKYAVAQCFLPNETSERHYWEEQFRIVCADYGLKLSFSRTVPTNPACAGPLATAELPSFRQFVFEFSDTGEVNSQAQFQLYFFRKRLEHIARTQYGPLQRRFHIVSLSAETICYKALVRAEFLADFYPDLTHPSFESAFALAHLRFSTNTQPSWALAQPFRTLCHNGEINTLRGNINAQYARTPLLSRPQWQDQLDAMGPVCVPGLSDSAMLDNMAEFLLLSGRSIAHVMSMLVPEPWQKDESMHPPLRDFYEYHSYQLEPWDGPSLIGFCSGEQVGAVLDRNGLRPGRYCVTRDDFVILASEAGALPQPWDNIKESGRLTPGRIFLVDMAEGRIVPSEEIKSKLAQQSPYGEWLAQHRFKIENLTKTAWHAKIHNNPTMNAQAHPQDEALTWAEKLRTFGYTREEIKTQITPLALTGKEAVGSMGSDVPLAVLSKKRPLLFEYFKQSFAQVTNPPVDVIREVNVTSLRSHLGSAVDLLQNEMSNKSVISLNQPLLNSENAETLKSSQLEDLRVAVIDTIYNAHTHSLAEALNELHMRCLEQIQHGAVVLILSDKNVTRSQIPIPSLLAVSSVHHFLMRKGVRGLCSLVAETGEARDPHACALLLGYGAAAIHPYLAIEILRQKHLLTDLGHISDRTQLEKSFMRGLCDGILKIMSKLGITDLNSYRGAQTFEILGLNQATVDEHFTWTPSRIGGIGLSQIEEDLKARHQEALGNPEQWLEFGGKMQWNRDGEKHLHSPDMIAQLQNSVRIRSRDEFRKYCETVDSSSKQGQNLRGILTMRSPRPAVPIEEVETVEQIVKRFCTGAMSLGSISREAHESIALAMNRIGGKSNSGEGGEDPERYQPDHNGEMRRSQTKQIASGRFGVTLEYLQNATELQIKIAQGAKPGEGGQLPGDKVDPYIAQLRHSTTGVTLISPPPHHDIYSIEDLAQLIHDLKNANLAARINVKLVSNGGIGTVACGVVKAKAEAIMVSGAEGGTGASPVSSILHAGLPWELGLAEVHKSLVQTGLRNRTVLQVDGQLRTARDLAIAVLLGAQEWGIATGALISLGCIMMRKCHLNSCPVGIATQDPELRKKFEGQPEHLINYMFLLAEELRIIMAQLGFRAIDEMVGRSECLEVDTSITDDRIRSLDLSALLSNEASHEEHFCSHTQPQLHGIENGIDEKVLIPTVIEALEQGKTCALHIEIKNTHRSVGTRLSSVLNSLPRKTERDSTEIHLHFNGSAGQSFMAFAASRLQVTLQGEANDYVCKGLSGAQVAIVPHPQLQVNDSQNVICGNTALYGATSGRLYVRGLAGERFAVRNSGAIAVVEGLGDHGCEYMTGGTVFILGAIGQNFGAGMSGGTAYIYDPHSMIHNRLNSEMVTAQRGLSDCSLKNIHDELHRYWTATRSPLARCILEHWESQKIHFVSVAPKTLASRSAQHCELNQTNQTSYETSLHSGKTKLGRDEAHG